MQLNLKAIIHTPGERLPFSFSMDLSDVELGGEMPFVEPILVSGIVKNTAGALVLDGEAVTKLSLHCDRCTKVFQREKRVPFHFLLAEELAGEDMEESILLLEDGKLDLDDVAYTTFILEMDTKNLCSEDCKGICPGCGVDLNEEACVCKPQVDPRWASLSQLLDTTE